VQLYYVSAYSPQRGYFVALIDDITERKLAEKEVKKRIKELQAFYDIAIGRELKMIGLKEKIEELKKEIEKHKNL
jgi:hypothetical protein